jgi:hypothetical protein
MRVTRELKVTPGFIDNLMHEVANRMLARKYSATAFYTACEECRIANELKSKELETFGHKMKLGKNQGTLLSSKVGWSEDGTWFMGNTELHPSWRGVIPHSLYWYMVGVMDMNDYWTTDNNEIKKHREYIIKNYVFGSRLSEIRTHQVQFGDRKLSLYKKDETHGEDAHPVSETGSTTKQDIPE